MHPAVKQYVQVIKDNFPHYFKGCKVLEMGSLNINGSVRKFFRNCKYTGIDKTAGVGVDVVCLAHEAQFKDRSFDVVISTEMLEHDKYARKSMLNAMKLLKKGGILIVTAAGKGRPSHFEYTGEDGHYENITRKMVENSIGECVFDETKEDIRFYKIK